MIIMTLIIIIIITMELIFSPRFEFAKKSIFLHYTWNEKRECLIFTWET
jgi:hypothetical protein